MLVPMQTQTQTQTLIQLLVKEASKTPMMQLRRVQA
jgi:hypothetical protein